MANDDDHKPRYLPQVTISSTFVDLEQHRATLIKCLKEHGLAEAAMENSSAKLIDVIEASLTLVRDGAAYVGVISRRYGDIPLSAEKNADGLSLTELEFSEAMRLARPILLFIMSDKHLGRQSDFESDLVKLKKLDAFRERAKRMSPGSTVHRVYAEFNSLEEFKELIAPAVSDLRRHLDEQDAPTPKIVAPIDWSDRTIPKPPALYAEPDYIGSHKFVGRQSQLQELNDWALPADPHNVLLFEAIGGNGKSMLTWEWTKNHAPVVRTDWAGRFWYSFYEYGAVMADFCQRALAYMTGESLKTLRKRKTRDLTKELLAQLHARPWLLILDGLERVLVAYNRIDAAEMSYEEECSPSDRIADRDPCAAIRDEDDDLLRALTAVVPSKVLMSSRLTPRALLNSADQPIPGVRRVSLPGLRPPDAEAMLRACGIEGTSKAIQTYLSTNCDCHPLVIGVLAGLINTYLPDKGNFDTWVSNPNGGGQFNLARMDLTQRRNNILKFALAELPPRGHRLLSTLSLLSESIDFPTLAALYSQSQRENPKRKVTLTHTVGDELSIIILDLQHRGLLQYDATTRRYDLHPVVRGVAIGDMKSEEKKRFGGSVADYFSQQTDNPYEEAETLDDLRNGLTVVRTLVKIGRLDAAANAYSGDLSDALTFNLEAYSEQLSLLRPFFSRGWGNLPRGIPRPMAKKLSVDAGIALDGLEDHEKALDAVSAALKADLEDNSWHDLRICLRNSFCSLDRLNRLAKSGQICALQLELATVTDESRALFVPRLGQFDHFSKIGRWKEAESIWRSLNRMARPSERSSYRPGDAEFSYALHQYWKGALRDSHLFEAQKLATVGRNRIVIREVHGLCGAWRLDQRKWSLASGCFYEAIRLARERGIRDVQAEGGLALAKFHLGQFGDSKREAELLALARQPPHRYLAMLWNSMGEVQQARKHAFSAYKWAWADGEPFVNRYELTKTTELLNQLGIPIPNLAPYDPTKNKKFPWEDAVVTAIRKLRTEYPKNHPRRPPKKKGRSKGAAKFREETPRKGGRHD